jgi:hypothetical protein
MRRRCLTLAALAVGFWGFAGTVSVAADAPKADAAARQKFVALLTSVRPESKATPSKVTHSKAGSLRAFGGIPPATPVGGGRGR